jgi:LPPG:FO 2-phospho-L-lactate transferase
MLLVLSGGTGTPKLLQGFIRLLSPEELSVLVNTGEDVEVSGLNISPDLDTVLYTLAGLVDDEKWYGIRGDTFFCHEMLDRLGHKELLRLGDKDRAIKSYRTLMLREGKALSEVTDELRQRLGARSRVFPMTDDRVRTRVDTEGGSLSFHEFWVARRAADKVTGVSFEGAEEASPAPGVIKAIESASAIVVGPSNPVTSIGPILAIKKIREVLARNREKVLAVSPVVGDRPVSGPTGVLMEGLGYEVSPVGVAQMYRDVMSKFLLHQKDSHLAPKIEELDMQVFFTDLLMPNHDSRVRLAREVLQIIKA